MFSRPRPALFGRRPTETSTRLNVSVRRAVGVLEADFDRVAAVGQRGDLGVQVDAGEELLQPVVQRLDQVAIGQRQQRGRQLDDAHLRAQLGIDRAHLQADVAAADDQQALGHVGQFKRAGRVHHAVGRQLEGRGIAGIEPLARMQCSNVSAARL